jgi:hypothetical protein
MSLATSSLSLALLSPVGMSHHARDDSSVSLLPIDFRRSKLKSNDQILIPKYNPLASKNSNIKMKIRPSYFTQGRSEVELIRDLPPSIPNLEQFETSHN